MNRKDIDAALEELKSHKPNGVIVSHPTHRRGFFIVGWVDTATKQRRFTHEFEIYMTRLLERIGGIKVVKRV